MFLAWKEMKKNKGKFAIVTLVLVATMYLVLFTISLTTGLQQFGASKIINSSAETFILSDGSNGSLEASSFSDMYAYDIMQDLDDENAFILGVQMANMQNTSKESNEVFGTAYLGMEEDAQMSPEIIEGSPPQNPGEVVVSPYIQNAEVEIGDTIHDVDQNISFTVSGFTEDETFNYSPIVYVSPEQFTQTSFLGQAFDFSYVQAVVTQIEPENIPTSIMDEYDAEINSRSEIIMNTPGLLPQSVAFFLLIVSMYVISGTILAMFFYIITMQKKREYGQLKAFGASTKYLAKSIISQVTLVVLISLAFAVGLVYITEALLPGIVPFLVQGSYILGSSVIFLFVALLGSFASLYQISKVDPVEAIGGNN